MSRSSSPRHIVALGGFLTLVLSAAPAQANPIIHRDDVQRESAPDPIATDCSAIDPALRPQIARNLPPLPLTFAQPLRGEISVPPAPPPEPADSLASKIPIPEPASIVLLTTGLVGLIARRHLLRKRA